MPEGGGVMKKSEWGTRTQAVKNVCCEEKKGTEVSSWIKRNNEICFSLFRSESHGSCVNISEQEEAGGEQLRSTREGNSAWSEVLKGGMMDGL